MENVTPERHASEEELIAHYYGCEEPGAGIVDHLAVCAACRADLEALKRDLVVAGELSAPDPGPGYESALWSRLAEAEPALAPSGAKALLGGKPLQGWRAWFRPRQLGLAGALAALVLAAFLAGRYSNGVEAPERATVRGPGKAAQERILAAALDTHLANSERMLLDVVNGDVESADWSLQRERAVTLVDSNRLYRMTAERQGQLALAAVLDDLERVLIELSHAPVGGSESQFTPLRERITDQELVFKLRILQLRLREQPRRRSVDRKG